MTAQQPRADIPISPVIAAPEGTVRAWASQVVPLTGRQLLVWVRDPFTMIQSLLLPALSMVLFKVLLGSSIGATTGQNSAYGMVPMVILIGAMFGSTAAAVRLNQERSSGLLGRLYVMPINRGADITSRVAAELVRILLTTLMLLAAGYFIGFRFTQGVLPALALVGVALLYGMAFAMLVLAAAVSVKPGAPLVPYISLMSSLMMFFNSGFVPLDMYPGWVQPFVKYQPMSPAIEVMRSLAIGGPLAANLILVLAWTLGILALCTYPALRGYRKAATDR